MKEEEFKRTYYNFDKSSKIENQILKAGTFNNGLNFINLYKMIAKSANKSEEIDKKFSNVNYKPSDLIREVYDDAFFVKTVQSSEESVVTLSVNKRKVVGMDFSSEDLTLHIDDFSARFIRPAAARLAREVDLEIAKEILINGQRVARATITNDVSFADCTATNAILAQQFEIQRVDC